MDTLKALGSFLPDFSAATWFLLASAVLFIIIFMKESNDDKSPLYWRDMLLDNTTQRLSLTKFGQFIGIGISTWVVVTIVDKHGTITLDVFGLYLAYLLGSLATSNYFKNQAASTTPPPQQ